MTTAPFNIIVAPFEVWIAPVGTDFPDLDADPESPWSLLGLNGNRDYDEDGVHVFHSETIDYHQFLGSTGARKATRSAEALRVEFKLDDMTLESYAYALGGPAITTVAAGAGTIGTKSVPIHKGFDVLQFATLVRGPGPYMDGPMQYEIPVMAYESDAEVVYNKTDPAGLSIKAQALEDDGAASDDERFGRLIAQSAAATA